LLDLEETASVVARVGGSVSRSEAKLRPHFVQTSLDNDGSAFYATIGCSALHVDRSLCSIMEAAFIVAMKGRCLGVTVR
jgi:hypothetical protein